MFWTTGSDLDEYREGPLCYKPQYLKKKWPLKLMFSSWFPGENLFFPSVLFFLIFGVAVIVFHMRLSCFSISVFV